jgi:hypothetical protein
MAERRSRKGTITKEGEGEDEEKRKKRTSKNERGGAIAIGGK